MTRRRPFRLLAAALIAAAPAAGCAPREDLGDRVPDLVATIEPDLIALRRDLHQHPELSGQEARTASLLAARLRDLGLPVQENVGGHGLVAILEGARPGPTVAYRADIDAFQGPDEPEEIPWRSTVPGVRHICGHDLHATVAVGIAAALRPMREQMRGRIRFLFQPAEETLEGARAMIADEALGSPLPVAIYALHTAPLPVGTVAIAPGFGFAGMQRLRIEWREGTDVPAGRIVAAVRSIGTVAPPASPEEYRAMIADLGVENGPYASFVFAEAWPGREPRRVHGLLKASADDAYPALLGKIRQALAREGLAGGDVEIVAEEPFHPSMINDVAVTEAAAGPLARAVGAERVMRLRATLPFFLEDYALFLKEIPGTMVFLGVANAEAGLHGIPHDPGFQIDEKAIAVGTRAMATLLLDHLERR